MGCSELQSATLNEGLVALGPRDSIQAEVVEGRVFSDTGIESIRLPSTLKVIEAHMFCNCNELKSVEFAEGLEKISLGAFQASGLENVVLPKSLKTICHAAFALCSHLRDVTGGEGLEIIGSNDYINGDRTYYGAFERSGLEHVELHSALKVIECNAFKDCKNLKKIMLPNGLEKIGALAFHCSAIEEIELPESLKEISPDALDFCYKLRKVAAGACSASVKEQLANCTWIK